MSTLRIGIRPPTPGRCTPNRTASRRVYRGRFLFFGTGYYNYDEPYTPDFPGIETFGGDVVHPQFWPEALDYTGKTCRGDRQRRHRDQLIPALAGKAAQVTMLQRSPTYMMSRQRINPMVQFIRKVLPRKVSHAIVAVYLSVPGGRLRFCSARRRSFGRWLIRQLAIAASARRL